MTHRRECEFNLGCEHFEAAYLSRKLMPKSWAIHVDLLEVEGNYRLSILQRKQPLKKDNEHSFYQHNFLRNLKYTLTLTYPELCLFNDLKSWRCLFLTVVESKSSRNWWASLVNKSAEDCSKMENDCLHQKIPASLWPKPLDLSWICRGQIPFQSVNHSLLWRCNWI